MASARGAAQLVPRPSLDPLSTVWEGCQQQELLDAADWLLGDSPRAAAPMPGTQQQRGAACACAAAPPRQPSWRASTDSSHLTRVCSTEGVESWLAGWGKLAEEQGCAVSPLETSTMQALLQRVPSQPARRSHSSPQEPAPARRPAARASCDFGAGVALQLPRPLPQQWQEGVACYQQCAAPQQPALSDGGSNSAGQGPSGESSYYRTSEELHSAYSRGLASMPPQQESPCRCCGRMQPPTARPPPHPAAQQQYASNPAACYRRQRQSVDLGALPRAVPRGRSSMEAWGESGAIAAARADVLASLAVRAHKRKSEEVLELPPASHARLPAAATNWRVAMGSSFYSGSAPPPQPPEAPPQQMYKRPHGLTDPVQTATASALYSRASPPVAVAGYGGATTPPPPRCSLDPPRGAATPAPAVPAAVPGTPELACGSFLQAMQEAAAAAPQVSQPFHQALQAPPQQAQRLPGAPCPFNMLGWNEVLLAP